MTYLSDRARARKTYVYYGLLIIIFSLVVYMWPTIHKRLYPYLENITILTSNLKISILNIPSSIGIYFTSRKNLETRNMDLSLSIERLLNELAEKDSILKERGFLETNGMPITTSSMVMYPVMRDITNIYSTLILSKGFKDGVEENSLVYVYGKQPVCIIKEVYNRTSLCQLLSVSGNTLEGVVASSTVLFLKGVGGGTFVADVPKDTDISLGDVVVLKSDQSMTLGKVANIIQDDQASSWYIYVRGAYNPVTSTVFYVNKR